MRKTPATRQELLPGTLDMLILKSLSLGVMHGYGIAQHIKTVSGDVLKVEEGSLYPALHRMEEAGLIRAKWIEKENGRRARSYELTAQGRKQLESEEARWVAVTGAVQRVLKLA